jgi:hypothetical protein
MYLSDNINFRATTALIKCQRVHHAALPLGNREESMKAKSELRILANIAIMKSTDGVRLRRFLVRITPSGVTLRFGNETENTPVACGGS